MISDLLVQISREICSLSIDITGSSIFSIDYIRTVVHWSPLSFRLDSNNPNIGSCSLHFCWALWQLAYSGWFSLCSEKEKYFSFLLLITWMPKVLNFWSCISRSGTNNRGSLSNSPVSVIDTAQSLENGERNISNTFVSVPNTIISFDRTNIYIVPLWIWLNWSKLLHVSDREEQWRRSMPYTHMYWFSPFQSHDDRDDLNFETTLNQWHRPVNVTWLVQSA